MRMARFTSTISPIWWRTAFGEPGGGFDTGTGSWKIQRKQGWWELELDFLDTKGCYGSGATLIGHKPPYQISLTVGDPDNGRTMRFSRVESVEGN